MKTIAIAFLSLLLAAVPALPGDPPVCTAKMVLNANDTSIAVNETATVTLFIKQDCESDAYQAFIVPSDPGVLTIESAAFDAGSPYTLPLINTIHSGELDLAAGSLSPVTGGHTLATITVRGLSKGTSTLTFTNHQPNDIPSAVAVNGEYVPCGTYASQAISVE